MEQLLDVLFDRFRDPVVGLPKLTIDYAKGTSDQPILPKQFTLCDAVYSSDTSSKAESPQITLQFKSLATMDVIEVGVTRDLDPDFPTTRITSLEIKPGGGSISGGIGYDVVSDDFVASLSTALNSTQINVMIPSDRLPGTIYE